MPGREEEPSAGQKRQEQPGPFELPLVLAEFLAGRQYAMVTEMSDQGTVFVVKIPDSDLAGMPEHVAIEVRHDLHQHELAPHATEVPAQPRPRRASARASR